MNNTTKKPNLYLALLVAIIAVVAVIVAVSSGDSVKNLDSASPQGVVQKYLQHITDGRNDLAASHFSSDSKCTAEDIDRAYVSESLQISLLKSEIENETAIVKVSISYQSSVLGDDLSSESKSFRLKLENGEWKISGIPWPLYDCGVINK